MLDKDETLEITGLASGIVAAYVSNHKMESAEISGFINLVYKALCNFSSGGSSSLLPAGEPAVPIKESVQPDYIVCLEDGRKLKMLKRHLKNAYNMTPDGYRERWGLPSNYPMVAPNYAKKRSMIAKTIGLGKGQKIRKKAA